MYVKACEVSILIHDAFTIKDKRNIIKSMIKKIHNKFNASISEVESYDLLNKTNLGIALVSNSNLHNQQSFDRIIFFIEENYQVEIIDMEDYY